MCLKYSGPASQECGFNPPPIARRLSTTMSFCSRVCAKVQELRTDRTWESFSCPFVRRHLRRSWRCALEPGGRSYIPTSVGEWQLDGFLCEGQCGTRSLLSWLRLRCFFDGRSHLV